MNWAPISWQRSNIKVTLTSVMTSWYLRNTLRAEVYLDLMIDTMRCLFSQVILSAGHSALLWAHPQKPSCFILKKKKKKRKRKPQIILSWCKNIRVAFLSQWSLYRCRKSKTFCQILFVHTVGSSSAQLLINAQSLSSVGIVFWHFSRQILCQNCIHSVSFTSQLFSCLSVQHFSHIYRSKSVT